MICAAAHVEEPRIRVTLATAIPEERCRRINLGFLDHREIDPEDWLDREEEGVFAIRNAGEILYRAADLFGEAPPIASRTRSGAY
jgi:hypothetical protein